MWLQLALLPRVSVGVGSGMLYRAHRIDRNLCKGRGYSTDPKIHVKSSTPTRDATAFEACVYGTRILEVHDEPDLSQIPKLLPF